MEHLPVFRTKAVGMCRAAPEIPIWRSKRHRSLPLEAHSAPNTFNVTFFMFVHRILQSFALLREPTHRVAHLYSFAQLLHVNILRLFRWLAISGDGEHELVHSFCELFSPSFEVPRPDSGINLSVSGWEYSLATILLKLPPKPLRAVEPALVPLWFLQFEELVHLLRDLRPSQSE